MMSFLTYFYDFTKLLFRLVHVVIIAWHVLAFAYHVLRERNVVMAPQSYRPKIVFLVLTAEQEKTIVKHVSSVSIPHIV